jgi:hypothetical protein
MKRVLERSHPASSQGLFLDFLAQIGHREAGKTMSQELIP